MFRSGFSSYFLLTQIPSISCFYIPYRQIEIDAKFLEEQHIMDYSLLLGVHYRAPQHLRSLMVYSRSMRADGLETLTEEGECL